MAGRWGQRMSKVPQRGRALRSRLERRTVRGRERAGGCEEDGRIFCSKEAEKRDECESARLDIWTFNLRTESRSQQDGIHGWPNRRNAVCQLIKNYDADIIATQEGRISQLEFLDQALGTNYKWFGCCRNGTHEDEHCAIFYNTDKFKLIKGDTLWLSETPDIPGSVGWDGAKARIATWVLLDCKLGVGVSRHVLVMNTHLDHVGVVAREQSARILLSTLRSLENKYPYAGLILTGDFNSIKDSNEVYKTLTQVDGLSDVWTSACCRDNMGAISTIHKFLGLEFKECMGDGSVSLCKLSEDDELMSPDSPGYGSDRHEQHIDWILFRNRPFNMSSSHPRLEVIACSVITDSLQDILAHTGTSIDVPVSPAPLMSKQATVVAATADLSTLETAEGENNVRVGASFSSPSSTSSSSSFPPSSLLALTKRYPSDHFPVAATVRFTWPRTG
eukprot:CAMPEP_0184494046 /NCGR_PEP_ID=MMETSP0113_2-20130426/27675_1 /TAXON_ID=91329 /ORGANISM="Norrisiella sphaerica, Strain BC52" /LENGTH=446 /DNA_ID=CAMNT_0026879601 /DNA_START=236 /DNA_END=1576 /DNA_ORIENTATION=+